VYVIVGEWITDIPNFGLLRVSQETIEDLKFFRQLKDDAKESGGVLIGKHLNAGGAILIDDFTRPQSTDKQGRCSYFRSTQHSEVVQEIWEKTNRQSTYVGLWHTHPEQLPQYSNADKKDWLNTLKNSQYDGKYLFFFIVGTKQLVCWMGSSNSRKIKLVGEYCFDNS
jgi:integrative and conjugative element protein (TIGR02256 family)